MKRIFAAFLSMLLLLSCAACSDRPTPSVKKYKPVESPTESESTEPVDPPEDIEPDEPDVPVALKIKDHDISDAELTYFYVDVISQWYNAYGAYAAYFGLDVGKGLDSQIYDPDKGLSWADYFMDLAICNAQNTYALCDAAEADGFTLSDEQFAQMDKLYDELEADAKAKKQSVTEFLQDIYGKLSDESSYKQYYEATALASFYYSHYSEALKESYTAEQLRAFEGEESYKYDSYSYAYYYLDLQHFAMGGTTNSNGQLVYSEEELNAAKAYLENVKNTLSSSDINTVEQLNAAIVKVENLLEADKRNYGMQSQPDPNLSLKATENHKVLYPKVSTLMQEWMRDSSRNSGDITAMADETTSKDANGNDVKTLKGYYIVLFLQRHDNDHPLANVRHILAAFEGGTYNSTTGTTTYSDAEKKAAREKADKLLAEWKSGDATEASFAEMSNKHSADGDGTTGGLYENVYPGQMVVNFNDWCFDESRKPGDTGIVESVYGYHVMYYVGDSDENYRDYMVTNDLLSKDMTEWQEGLISDATVEEKDLDRIDKDLVLKDDSLA